MSPLLFPVLLMLYGELSEDEDTRKLARLFFYSYACSVLIFTFMSPTVIPILLSLVFLIATPVYILSQKPVTRLKPFLCLLIGLYSLNGISVVTQSYNLILNLPLYFEYSNIILRECTILTIGLHNITKGVDTRLKIITGVLYLVEYSYITGI